jgi:hypothetical protein
VLAESQSRPMSGSVLTLIRKIAKLCITQNAKDLQNYANFNHGNRNRDNTNTNQIGNTL